MNLEATYVTAYSDGPDPSVNIWTIEPVSSFLCWAGFFLSAVGLALALYFWITRQHASKEASSASDDRWAQDQMRDYDRRNELMKLWATIAGGGFVMGLLTGGPLYLT